LGIIIKNKEKKIKINNKRINKIKLKEREEKEI